MSKGERMRATMEMEDGEKLLCCQCGTLFHDKIAYVDIDDEEKCVEGVYCSSCVRGLHRRVRK